MFDAIHRIAIGKEPAPENLKDNAQQLLVALGVDPQTIQGAQKKITDAEAEADKLKAEATNVQNQVATVLATLPDEVRAGAENVMGNMINAATTVGSKLTAAGMAAAGTVMAAAGDIDSAYQKFQYWTCICEERAQQWVTMHTRILTVIFACIFAFWLQLDTVEIFKLVSSNKAVRDKLVAQATAVSSQAEKTLADSPSVLQKAYQQWLAATTDQKIKDALKSANVNVTATDTRETVIRQIDKALTEQKIDKPSKDAALKSFNTGVDDAVKASFNDSGTQYAKVKGDLDDTGFVLFPTGSRWRDGWSFAHFIGVLFSVGLLSLGAPFWYHSLKDLVSLRSQVAQNIAEQKDKLGPEAKPSEAPPTVKPADEAQAKQAAMFIEARKKLDALKSVQGDPTKLEKALDDLDATLTPKAS